MKLIEFSGIELPADAQGPFTITFLGEKVTVSTREELDNLEIQIDMAPATVEEISLAVEYCQV